MSELLPPYSEVPEEFKQWHGNKWVNFQNDWFMFGLKDLEIKVKPGIDKAAAMRHLKAIQGSWDPKHEHKSAGVAYLASLWFDDITYEKKAK